MPNFIQFTPEKLNSVSLSVLREIAREIGVKAPTSKTVPTLISEIILIQRGELIPIKSTRGARSKSVDISAYYVKEHEFPLEEYQEYAASPIEELTFMDDHVKIEEGLLHLAKDDVAYLRSLDYVFTKNDAIITEEILKDYDLRPGDLLKCRTVVYGDKKRVCDLIEINGINANEHVQSMDFMMLPVFYPNQPIELKNSNLGKELSSKSPINKGQRALIAIPNNVDSAFVAVELARALSNDVSLKTYLLLIGETPEEIDEIKRSSDVEVIATRFDADYAVQTDVAELFIEKLKRAVERGEDVAVVTKSATNLVKAYLGGEDKNVDFLSKTVLAIMNAKRLISNAVNTSKGSLTILFLVDYSEQQSDVAIFGELNSVANMRAVLTSENTVDKDASFARAYNLLNTGARDE